ncbi:MAG TPA: hypothetical protein VGB08_08375 [Allosphingosinicella sp.]
MNRRFSALLLSAIGAGALLAAPGGESREAVAADTAAVDRYIAQLSETVPRPATARLAAPPPEDPKLAKSAAKLDRTEPIAAAVFNIAR